MNKGLLKVGYSVDDLKNTPKFVFVWFHLFPNFGKCDCVWNIKQTSANHSTWPRYSKNIWYSAKTRGPIVGQIVVRYSTRPQVEYLYFGRLWLNPSILWLSFDSAWVTKLWDSPRRRTSSRDPALPEFDIKWISTY